MSLLFFIKSLFVSIFLVSLFSFFDGFSSSVAADTLREVKNRGFIRCGVHEKLTGFSMQDAEGNWSGFDIDLCRAVAAAIFGDATKVVFVPLTARARFTALQKKEIDVLTRNTTWTMERDTSMGLRFVGVSYYDGQGFMLRKSMHVVSALELTDASVCAQSGTTTEINVLDYFENHSMPLQLVALVEAEEVVEAYEEGQCEVLTADMSSLYAYRLVLEDPEEHTILPEIISKEPLGPLVQAGDDRWFNIVKWTLFALLNAEELNVTLKNAVLLRHSSNPAIRRLLGTEGAYGKNIGLSNDWGFQIISEVGNYGEIYERNIGSKTPLRVSRGMNALWSQGGLMYAPPIR